MIWCVDSDAASRNMAVYALQAAGFEAEGYPCADSFWGMAACSTAGAVPSAVR